MDDEVGDDVYYWLRTGEVVDSCGCSYYTDFYGAEAFVRPVLWLNKKKAKSFIKIAHEGKPASSYEYFGSSSYKDW